LLHFSRISAVILTVSRKLTGFSALSCTYRLNSAKPDISRKILSAMRKYGKIRLAGLVRLTVCTIDYEVYRPGLWVCRWTCVEAYVFYGLKLRELYKKSRGAPAPIAPLPFHALFLPLSSVLSASPLLEVGPILAARGYGEQFSSPNGSGQSPVVERYCVNFRLKI